MLCYAMPGNNFCYSHALRPFAGEIFETKQVEGSLVRYEITCGQHITRWIRSIVFMAS